jgi:hypothetical protein
MANNEKQWRYFAGILFILLLLVVLLCKGIELEWFSAKSSLELKNQPAILFFNKVRGCECEMVVYTAAERQIVGWVNEERLGIPIIRIDLDRRPDLGIQYHIVRAPTIVLVDRDGGILYSQKEAISDSTPLDLDAVTAAIKEMPDGN